MDNEKLNQIIVRVQAGIPVCQAIQGVYANKMAYYRANTDSDIRRVKMIALEQRELARTRKRIGSASSGLYISISPELKTELYRLALLRNQDVSRLVRGLIKVAIRRRG